MDARRRVLVPIAVLIVSVGGMAATVVLEFLARNDPGAPSTWGSRTSAYIMSVAYLAFPVVGAFIYSRNPGNKMGTLFLGIGLVLVLAFLPSGYANYGLIPGRDLPGAVLAAWLSEWTWTLWVGLIGIFTILLFPDGRVLGPRWRWVGWLGGFAMLASSLVIALLPEPMDGYPGLQNPFGLEAMRGKEAVTLVIILIPVSIILAGVSIVKRYRRSRGIERLQLKWFLTAGLVVAVLYAIAFAASFRGTTGTTDTQWVLVVQDLALISFALLPIATGVAVLRYRLYNIDRLINRSLVYGLLSVSLGGIYVLTLVLLQAVLSRFLRSGDLLIAASTLVAVGISRPLRNRIQRFIDKRFYRSRYDAQRVVDSLARTLRANTDAVALEFHVLDAVTRTVQPKSARLWLVGSMR